MTDQVQVETSLMTAAVAGLAQMRMLQLTMGTGIAGAVIENGQPWSHLCEPGKVCLNLVPPGGFLFPHGLAANNQLARAALERAGRIQLNVPDECPLEVRWIAAIGNGDETPAELDGTLPDDASTRATEVFRMLGRGLGDLIVTLMPHIDFSAVGLAGGPLKGMPDVIASEITSRCALYGYEVQRIAQSVPVFVIQRTGALQPNGPLGDALRGMADAASEYSAELLKAMIERSERELWLVDDEAVREAIGRYLPVSAYRVIMDELHRRFPSAPSFSVDFDGKPFAVVPTPATWEASDAVNLFLAKYPCAVVVNQAMTAGFGDCNYLSTASIAATTAALPVSAGHRYAFEGAPYATGLGVISARYYSTWKDVCAATSPASVAPVPSSPETPDESPNSELAIGVDIGGSNIKVVVLRRSDRSASWEICCHPASAAPAVSDSSHHASVGSPPRWTSPANPLDEFETGSAILAPNADIDHVAEVIVKRIQRLGEEVAPGATVVKVGIVFPAAVANGIAVAAPSRIAGAFAGQTTMIINATAEQLLNLNVIAAFQRAWQTSNRHEQPEFRLANDGPASAFGAYSAVFGRPAGISDITEPEGGFGAIGVAQM